MLPQTFGSICQDKGRTYNIGLSNTSCLLYPHVFNTVKCRLGAGKEFQEKKLTSTFDLQPDNITGLMKI
jgi:hypothetical protein